MRYLAESGKYQGIRDAYGVSKAATSRAISRVTDFLASDEVVDQFIKFPTR